MLHLSKNTIAVLVWVLGSLLSIWLLRRKQKRTNYFLFFCNSEWDVVWTTLILSICFTWEIPIIMGVHYLWNKYIWPALKDIKPPDWF